MRPYPLIHSVVHGFVRRFGYRLERADRIPECTLDLLGMAIANERARAPAPADDKKFFFVQIGANDGLHGDPLRPHILKWQLPGLLVEPLPDVFQELVRNYQDQPQLRFENCAIVPQDGDVTLHRACENGHAADRLHQKTSLSKHVVQKHGGVGQTQEIRVTGLTAGSLFRKHAINEVSLLVIDAEGADFDILRQVLESGVRPRIVQLETRHLSAHDKQELRRELREQGYGFAETQRDTLAVQNA